MSHAGRRAVIERRAERAVSDYIAHHQADAAAEMNCYRATPSLRLAIRRAARAHTADGGKHPHQWRIPRDVLRKFGARLSREDRALRDVPSFDELHGVVLRAGDLTHGIGELAVYDTALRIGAKLDLPPLRVYLHRGSRDGAAMLGVDARRPSVAVSELPTAFATLEAHEIEDCLCIFKGLLSGERSLPPVGCRCGGRGCARPARSAARAGC